MSRSSTVLLDEVFPGLPRKRLIAEHEPLLSIDKVRRVLGYEPEHTWRASV
jgi:UDP-glucose 4-epimerase